MRIWGLSALLCVSFTAHSLTLEDIAEVYARKEAALGAYSVRFEEEDTFQRESGEEVPTKDVYSLTVDGPRYRIEERTFEPADLAGFETVSVCNGTEFKMILKGQDGAPHSVYILEKQTYERPSYVIDPVRLSGLWREPAPFATYGYAIDVQTIVRPPEARLEPEPVHVNGDRAWCVRGMVSFDEPNSGYGRFCHLWFSEERGFALLKCALYESEPSHEQEPHLEITFSDFFEVQNELWFPEHILAEWVGHDEEPLKRVTNFKISVLELKTGAQVTDEMFHLAVPERVVVMDDGRFYRDTESWRRSRKIGHFAEWFSEASGINLRQVRNVLIFVLVLVLGYFIFFRKKEKRASIE